MIMSGACIEIDKNRVFLQGFQKSLERKILKHHDFLVMGILQIPSRFTAAWT
jgi:hypothetical protein